MQIAEGNEKAFRTLYDLYKERFYGVAMKMSGSPYVSEEIVQEVFIALWKGRLLLANIRNPSAYLFTAFYNCLYHRFKKEAQEKRLKQELFTFGPDAESFDPEDGLSKDDLQQMLDSAIGALPPQQAMVIRLSKQEGLTREQVAEKMGISPNTVKNHMAGAVRSLKQISREAGFLIAVLGFYGGY